MRAKRRLRLGTQMIRNKPLAPGQIQPTLRGRDSTSSKRHKGLPESWLKITNDSYPESPLFYFALATPIDQMNEEDSRPLLESKNGTPTVIEIHPSPRTMLRMCVKREQIMVGQRELLVCTGHGLALGPGMHSGEVKNGQIRIRVAAKSREDLDQHISGSGTQ